MRNLKIGLLMLLAIPGMSQVLFCQDKVKVKDFMTDQPLSGVSITLKNKGEQTTTDNDGVFSLKSFKPILDNDTILFSFIGYALQEITVGHIKKSDNLVYLKLQDESLSQVTVTSVQPHLAISLPYSELADILVELSNFGVAIAENKIYIIGGDISVDAHTAEGSFLDEDYREASMKGMIGGDIAMQLFRFSDRMYIYDLGSDTWMISNHRFSKRAYHNVLYNQGKIYVLGGRLHTKNIKFERLNNKVEVYNIAQDSLIIDETNPHQAVNSASVIADNNIIVLGGSVKSSEHGNKIVKGYTNKVHMLDLKSGYWYELPDVPVANAEETKGIIAGNIIYLFGGYKERPLYDIGTYNISTGEYRIEGQLPQSMERPAVAFDNKYTVYLYDSGRIYTYNIHTGELSGYYIGFDVNNAEMLYENEALFILGGKKDNIPSSKVYRVNISDFKQTKSHSFR